MRTNRDLYLAITALIERQRDNRRTLEDYLRALAELGHNHRQRATLALDEFFQLLSDAFTADAPPFDESWRITSAENSKAPGFDGWLATLREQVVDLHEMQENGQLNDKYRYFGIRSPRGQRWYNFNPSGFLECATAGSYGGWEPGDTSERDFVPGPVTVLENDGTIGERDPRELPRPRIPIVVVTWEDFRYFLWDGQCYE
jgi:hypothetical protein